MLKKISYLLLALSLSFALCFSLAACGNKDKGGDNGGDNSGDSGSGNGGSEKVTYTVNVKDAAGNAVSGVKVQILDANGTETPYIDTTTEDGKLTFSLKSASYKVKVDKVPTEYIKPTASFSFAGNVATITLELKPLYTVKIVDQDGNVVTGANVQMCAESCIPLIESVPGSGLYTRYTNEDEFKAQINSLPEGYSFAEGTDELTKFAFDTVDGGFYVEIEVVKD